MYKSSFFSFVFRQPTCMELLRIYHTFGVQFSVFADKCVLRFFFNVIATNPWQRVFICAYCFVVSSMACIQLACLLTQLGRPSRGCELIDRCTTLLLMERPARFHLYIYGSFTVVTPVFGTKLLGIT